MKTLQVSTLLAAVRSKNLVFLRLGVFTCVEGGNNDNNSIRACFTALQRVIEAMG